MYTVEDIQIHNAVIHILDSNNPIPVLSDIALDLSVRPIWEYLTKHILKSLLSDECKLCQFLEEDNLFVQQIQLCQQEDGFVSCSKTLGHRLFELMKKHVDIGSADVIFCQFSAGEKPYFGILKMNYKSSFIHYVETETDGITAASIIEQRVALPSETQKIEEFVFIDTQDYSLLVQEKRVSIDDEKRFYLSDLYLQCSNTVSQKNKFQILNKVADQLNKKYYDSDIEKEVSFKKAVAEQYEEKGEIVPAEVIDVVYQNDKEAKEEFFDKIAKHDFLYEPIKPPEKVLAKKTERQIFRTDSGIELNIPLEAYGDQNLLEFITNTDGTITIIIKNITELKNH